MWIDLGLCLKNDDKIVKFWGLLKHSSGFGRCWKGCVKMQSTVYIFVFFHIFLFPLLSVLCSFDSRNKDTNYWWHSSPVFLPADSVWKRRHNRLLCNKSSQLYRDLPKDSCLTNNHKGTDLYEVKTDQRVFAGFLFSIVLVTKLVLGHCFCFSTVSIEIYFKLWYFW